MVTTSSLPGSSVFHLPCLQGTDLFFSIRFKAAGGKLLCFVRLRGSCMPVVIPSEFGLDCHFVLYSADERRGIRTRLSQCFLSVFFSLVKASEIEELVF